MALDGKGMVGENDIFLFPQDEQLTSVDLEAFVKENERISSTYRRNMEMYKGRYDIEKEPKKPLNKPDNRIAINFAKYLVNVFNGFFAGVAPQIGLKDEKQNDELQSFNNLSSVPDKISDLAKLCSIYGRAYMFLYRDEGAQLRATISAPTNSFIIYDDSVSHKPMYFVRYTKNKDDEFVGEVHSDNESIPFNNDFELGESEANPLGKVPAIEFMENDERLPLYDNSTISVMNAINKAISQKANDTDAIADAYLFFKGGDLDEEVIKNMSDNRVIAIAAGDSDAKFLERPNGDGTQENLLNRLVRNLFQTTMVTNLDDINATGNNQSGYSIELKMQAMRSLAAVKERKFVISLRKMYRVVFEFLKLKKSLKGQLKDMVTGSIDDPVNELKITFTRNLPKNIELEANVAKNLEGIVSKQTQLKALPSLVDDPQEEMELMRQEESEALNNAVKNNPASYQFEGVDHNEKQE